MDNWYEYLKEEIISEKWRDGGIDCAFRHGRVLFAWTAGLISEEQKKELCDMIPEY